jgi:cystathionine beta-lyase
MQYDFDREVSRRDTRCIKWEFVHLQPGGSYRELTNVCYGENRILPMWIADMDFPSPQPVIDALVARAQHGVYGYTGLSDDYYASVAGWMQRRHGWTVNPDWILTTPGVVCALHLLVRAFLVPGDKVLIQPPVYHPFFAAAENNGVGLAYNPLILEDGRYRMDFADLEQKAQDPAVKMLILCSPHNPVGRVWTREELTRLGEICLERGILVVSDEIHGDLILGGRKFTSYGALGESFAQQAVICTAPSKTFNVAGLKTSNIMIPNAELRKRFEGTLHSNGMGGANLFGALACEVAYNEGDEWLDQLLDYIQGNLRFLQDYLARHIPQISVIPPEGTYLVWLDCRRLGLDREALQRLMFEAARVYLGEGYGFGAEGEGFERMNIACTRAVLAEALERIAQAVAGLEVSHSETL